MKWTGMPVMIMTGVFALSACTTTIAGSGSAASSPHPTQATSSPSFDPPHTAIGNPRTADLCSLISAGAFERYGEVGIPAQLTPIDCHLQVRPAGATTAVDMSAYVYDYEPYTGGAKSRTVAGLEAYTYGFTDHYCRAMIAATSVAVGIEAHDFTGKAPGSRVCAMRDLLLAQVAGGITHHRVQHPRYGRTSLTTEVMCAHVDASELTGFPHHADLMPQSRAFGNDCSMSNAAYYIDIGVGLRVPPVRPATGGQRLNIRGYELIQESKATSTLCDLVSQQEAVPNSDYTEVVEALAELAPHHPADTPTGAALCTRIAAPLLVQFLEKTGRK